MAVFDPEFQAELRAESLHEDLIKWIGEHCGTPSKFANFVDAKTEIQTEMVDAVPATRGDRAVRAALVALWRKHEAAENRRLGRQAAFV